MISNDLLAAYRATTYNVFARSGTLTLRIDERNADIVDLHKSAGVTSSAFVTACNPFSAPTSDAMNAEAMSALKHHLDAASIAWVDGEGCGQDSNWPPEPSVLALGVDESGARELCIALQQNAVVIVAEDGVPRLLIHPERRADRK